MQCKNLSNTVVAYNLKTFKKIDGMPEGLSIVILKEMVSPFKGKTIIKVTGNAKIEKEKLVNKKIIDFRSWGKQFLICPSNTTIRIHFLLFGSYSINSQTKPDTKVYDETISTLRYAVDKAKLGNSDKTEAIKKLHEIAARVGKDFTPNANFDELIQKEKDESWKYGGKTVFGNAKPPKEMNKATQLRLF